MAKTKKAWFCQSCGAQHPQWMGQCKSCHAWNTLVEEVLEREAPTAVWADSSQGIDRAKAMPLSEVDRHAEKRHPTGDVELDRVLGGGLVPGSLVLLGGEPGIGKSTLLLQIALCIVERM